MLLAMASVISTQTTLGELASSLRDGGDVSLTTDEGDYLVTIRPVQTPDETECLLRSSTNAQRLRTALARDRSENRVFESVDELKNAAGA